MSAPANGATGVSTTVGSITLVPSAPPGIGTLLQQFPPATLTAGSVSLQSGALVASGSAYTATLPTLAHATTYTVYAPQMVSCAPLVVAGAFTTN
jgi:hypothetical protein